MFALSRVHLNQTISISNLEVSNTILCMSWKEIMERKINFWNFTLLSLYAETSIGK